MKTDSDRDLLPEGLEDRLPPFAAAAARVTRAVVDVLDAHGFDRVQPPSIEFEKSLASRMSGISSRKMFRFVDPLSLRMMALRSDITPQVGRIAATGLARAARPLRLCYAGQVVSIKGDGLDPTRERLQLGAELIGSDSVAAAEEIVAVAIEALRAAGATGISVDFTLPDLVDTLAAQALPLADDTIEAVRDLLDAKDAGGLASLGATAYLPFIEAAGPVGPALAKLRAIEGAKALDTRLEAIEAIAAAIGDRVTLTLDPTERHGFEYQRWIGFSLFGRGLSGEIGRGGSYTIVRPDGGEEKAIGFSLFIDPLVDVGLGVVEHKRVFLPLGTDPALAAKLRADDWITVAALSDGDDAAALGCTHILRDGQPAAL